MRADWVRKSNVEWNGLVRLNNVPRAHTLPYIHFNATEWTQQPKPKKSNNKLVDLPIFLHHGCFASRRRLPAVRAMSRCSMCFICIPFFKSLLHTMYKWAVRSLRCDCYRNRIDAEIYKTDRQTKYHNLSRSNFRLFNQQHNFKRKQYM